MAFASYPNAHDVEALLKSASYWPTDPTKQEFARLQADIGARAAADEWERLTGWAPFLVASLETSSREFEVRHGRVDFSGGALLVESVSIHGNNVGTFRTLPENALSRGTAITGLELAASSRVMVTARWGRVTYVPGDVWQAIQQKAALIALTQIENLQSIASISEDGFTKEFDTVGIVTQKDLVGIWGKDFEKVAGRWQRVVA